MSPNIPRSQRKRAQNTQKSNALATTPGEVSAQARQRQLESLSTSTAETRVAYSSEQYSGPLLHPNIVHKWEELRPGAADIIIGEFQAQGIHRRTLEAVVIQSDINRANLGLAAGFVVSMAAFGVCLFAIQYNQPWVAGVFGSGTLAALAGSFIYGSQNRRAEREQKSKDNP